MLVAMREQKQQRAYEQARAEAEAQMVGLNDKTAFRTRSRSLAIGFATR
jgi:hypothetical protein